MGKVTTTIWVNYGQLIRKIIINTLGIIRKKSRNLRNSKNEFWNERKIPIMGLIIKWNSNKI